MKVIFVQDLPNVADIGDVKEVKKGHARNYLFPKGFAVPATPDELQCIEARKRAAARQREAHIAEAQGLAGTLQGVVLTFAKRVTSKGNIYGSVSNVAIQQELKQRGHEVTKSMIRLESPLRQLGEHEVEIELTPDAIATITVIIEPSEPEKAETEPESKKEEAPPAEEEDQPAASTEPADETESETEPTAEAEAESEVISEEPDSEET